MVRMNDLSLFVTFAMLNDIFDLHALSLWSMKYIKKVVSSYDNPDTLLNLNFATKVTSLDLFGLGNLN